MSKKRKSISIDQSLAEKIDQRPDLNLSGLVNEFVKLYLAGDVTTHKSKTSLEVKLRHVREDIEQTKNQLDQLIEREERIEQRIEEYEDKQDPAIENAIEALQNTPDDEIHTENAAVKNWATNAGISTDKLVELVKNERE